MNISVIKKNISLFLFFLVFLFTQNFTIPLYAQSQIPSYNKTTGTATYEYLDGAIPELSQTIISTFSFKEPFNSVTVKNSSLDTTSSILKVDRKTPAADKEVWETDKYTDLPSEEYNLKINYKDSSGTLEFDGTNLAAAMVAFKGRYPELTKENLFAINTPSATHYYIKIPNKNAKGGYDKFLIGSAIEGNKLIIPQEKVKELGMSRNDDLTVEDMTREEGYLNYLGSLLGKEKGDLAGQIRSNDGSKAQDSNLTQQREDIQGKIDGVEREIQELKKKEEGGTLTDADKQRLSDLELQKGTLLSEQEQIRRYQLQSRAANATNEIRDCEKGIFGWASVDCAVAGIAIISNIGLKLVAYALGLAGNMFDYSIELAVNSAEFIEKIGVVNPVWTLVRDILNMTFIFILVWIAVQIIIDRKRYTIKKDVVRVVVIAILINFSLFFAKILVDGSNLATLQLYQATKSTGVPGDTGNISVRIMNTLGFQTIYDIGDIFGSSKINQTVKGCGNAYSSIISVAVFGSLFMIILTLAFLTVGVLFFTRMANIIYLLITSPLWIWGYILENGPMQKVREDWWKRMKRVIQFPVVFMLFMFVGVFAFTKMFALSYGGLSFLTLFCVSDTGSIISQLPLILNFCLVIWVILAALKYGIKNSEGSIDNVVIKKFGGWAEAASTGLAKKIGTKAKAAPKAVLYGTKEVLKQPVQRTARFVGTKLASSANNPAWVRNMGGKMAEKNKDITFFGKTGEQRKEAWKKWWAGEGEQDAKTTAGVAEGIHTAPKFQEKGFEEEDMNAYKYRLQQYAEAKAGIYLNSNILKVVDDDKTKNPDGKNHRERIIDAAIEEVEDPKDKTKKIYKLREERMRKQINDTFEAHTRKGRLAKIATHDKGTLMSKYKAEAREKGFKSVGSGKQKQAKTLDRLKADLDKAQKDFKNSPETVADLEKRISTNDANLKGLISLSAVGALQDSIQKVQENIAYIEDSISRTGSHPEQDKLNKYKEELEKKQKKLEDMKEGVVKNREKIEKKIEDLKKEIKETEKNN